jgi:TetR/AcrR family transcriptional repressor of nem operon
MPRNREFDIDLALDHALNAFWLKGYAATSMTDLMAAMGLSKSSFFTSVLAANARPCWQS